MIRILAEQDRLVLDCEQSDLAPHHTSQLMFWGFSFGKDGRYVGPSGDTTELAKKVSDYFERGSFPVELGTTMKDRLREQEDAESLYRSAREKAGVLKEGNLDEEEVARFLQFLENSIPRTLKDHQCKAALHLLAAVNGANFSVPGSGKTTVILTVFERLRQQGKLHSLFVVGPPSCFGPWKTEYQEVLGIAPKCVILAGGNIEARRTEYLVNQESVADLYLTTFQTLQRDWTQVKILFERQGVDFYFIVDEAHYVKQPGGVWATAVVNVARCASRRAVLTGTPFPQSFSDAFNLFDVLWPECSPIPEESRHRIELYSQKREFEAARECLSDAIGPLFYRVRKYDLDLAPQVFHSPIQIQMKPYERQIYDLIVGRIVDVSSSDYMKDLDLLVGLRKGRMMRLRQCLSYSAMLASGVPAYSENLADAVGPLGEVIEHYDGLEEPNKVHHLLELVEELRRGQEKVVIWANFVRTLEMLHGKLRPLAGSRLIYGATPVERSGVTDELTRHEIVQEFLDPNSGIDILLANPGACAESVSLHKSCSTAIYYDLSYNCAQYVQSLDRIHRIGGSEQRPAHYYFLQYEDTIDSDILRTVQEKAERMGAIIDHDYPIYSLDMFSEDEELDAYERLFIGG